MIDQVKQKKNLNQRVAAFLDKFFGVAVIIIALAIIIIGYFILIQGKYGEVRRKEQVDLVRTQNIVDRLHREQIQAQHVNASLEFTAAEERLISLALPASFDFSSVIVQLQGMAKKNNFTVEGIEVKTKAADPKKKTTTTNGLKKVTLGLTIVGGNYDNLKQFLTSLENSIMIFDAASLEFAGDAVTPKYRFNLTTYYYN